MIAPRTVTMREVLVAMDFSQQSARALDAALAQHFGARLHVLHVVPDVSEQKMALAKLKAFTGETLEGTEIARAVSVGQTAAEIVKYAGRKKIDLIVLGTHGRTGLIPSGQDAEQARAMIAEAKGRALLPPGPR